MNDAWQSAQVHESDFWKNFILDELTQRKFPSSAMVVGFRSCEFRFALTRLGYPWHDWQFSRPDSIVRGKWLDVGCGPVSMLEGSPARVRAIDPNLDNYARDLPSYCALGHVGNCYYQACHIQDVQDTDFDYVWCFNVLDHADNWQSIVQNFARVLKTGGTLLLSTDIRTFTDQYHIAVFTADELLQELRGSGLFVEWMSEIKTEDLYRFSVRAVKA